MNHLTALEEWIIEELLSESFGVALAASAAAHLDVEKREFSLDVLNEEFCVGFYLHLKNNNVLNSLNKLPHHISLHALHDKLPAGCDFILYLKAGGIIDYLEATFYGFSLPVADVVSPNHHFKLTN